MLAVMFDEDAMKTCRISDIPEKSTLIFLISIKIISLICVYCVPCLLLAAANVAIFFVIRFDRKNWRIRSTRKAKSRAKLQYTFSFLVFSALFMTCCLPAPIFDLKLAVNMLQGEAQLSAPEVIANACIWNLTTLAFTVNALIGMKYTNN